MISLAGARVVVARHADETIRLAARELERYLYLLTGKPCGARPATAVRLEVRPAMRAQLGDQGYHLRAAPSGRQRRVVLTAATPDGVLYGVYGLLEELGMGFYAGGDTFPELPTRALIPATLDKTARPAFTVRGNMLHYNFLCGPTTFGLDDYQFYFDQLARQRCNVLLMHWYDSEPGAAFELNGEYVAGGRTPNSLAKPWGALEALRTSQFYFDTARCFDAEVFSSPLGEDLPDLLTEIKRSEEMFRQATRYARTAGIRVAAGFEAPRTDPTEPQVRELFCTRLRQFLERNPDLTYFALWQHESGGCYATQPPAPGTAAARLLEEQRPRFAYLGNDRRVWEAIRFGRFAQWAAELLEQEAPRLRLVVCGWGGDRWMRFADYCLAYDKFLPPSVIFTCHDNIDASFGPNVSTPWGQLPPARERWAMPWVEGDIDDCWVRQPHVESLGKLAPDALRKGCQGLLTLQWRTRDVEEETGYIARFAWDTTLTPDRFYRDLARHAFGPDQAERMGRHLGTLQRLGARWTGVRGCSECAAMSWAGGVPHFPFEVDAAAVRHLLDRAQKARQALAEIPAEELHPDAGAFHERSADAPSATAATDTQRLGVAELSRAIARLEKLFGEPDEERLRAGLRDIEEPLWAVRSKLVARGMTSREYQSLDGFLIVLHHLQRNAGATAHFATLQAIRADLDRLRRQYVRQRRTARLERLDYLAATMDFALHHDAAVLLLADGGFLDQALAEAGRDPGRAAEIAAAAYGRLLEAGMHSAIAAFTRKLTTRSDFGTLATLNVKMLPLYWQTLGRLASFLPAVPPRELAARGQRREVWLSWAPVPRAAGLNLYRRRTPRGAWQRVNPASLAAACGAFVDRPRPGGYEYALTALDDQGGESPRSHPAPAVCGARAPDLRVIGCQPPTRLARDEALPVRAIVLSDRTVVRVELVYRQATDRAWHRRAMLPRSRGAYAGTVAGRPGVALFYVEATDADGNRAVWPASAAVGLPWSVSIL